MTLDTRHRRFILRIPTDHPPLTQCFLHQAEGVAMPALETKILTPIYTNNVLQAMKPELKTIHTIHSMMKALTTVVHRLRQMKHQTY